MAGLEGPSWARAKSVNSNWKSRVLVKPVQVWPRVHRASRLWQAEDCWSCHIRNLHLLLTQWAASRACTSLRLLAEAEWLQRQQCLEQLSSALDTVIDRHRLRVFCPLVCSRLSSGVLVCSCMFDFSSGFHFFHMSCSVFFPSCWPVWLLATSGQIIRTDVTVSHSFFL